MAIKITKTSHVNIVPRFCTGDLPNGSCMIYELKGQIDGMGYIEAMFEPVNVVNYIGTDAIVEDPHGSALLLVIRNGTILPDNYDGMELTWYKPESDGTTELALEDILTMCAI